MDDRLVRLTIRIPAGYFGGEYPDDETRLVGAAINHWADSWRSRIRSELRPLVEVGVGRDFHPVSGWEGWSAAQDRDLAEWTERNQKAIERGAGET